MFQLSHVSFPGEISPQLFFRILARWGGVVGGNIGSQQYSRQARLAKTVDLNTIALDNTDTVQ